MNIYQRLVLVLGAIALIIVLLTASTSLRWGDLTQTALREAVVLGSTLLLYLALSGIRRNKRREAKSDTEIINEVDKDRKKNSNSGFWSRFKEWYLK